MIRNIGMQNLGFGKMVKIGDGVAVNTDKVVKIVSEGNEATTIFTSPIQGSNPCGYNDEITTAKNIDKVVKILNTEA